jgi:Holliday junction DNA helicase RuvA
MIEYLRGTILHREEDHVVLEAGGVGYGLDVPGPTALRLGSVGDEATLWVYTHVGEDVLRLFGFQTRNEREVFEIFLGISGVGPRLALAILSTFSAQDLVQIVMTGDARALKAVPGIGLKKAEKLLLELKGRIDRIGSEISGAGRGANRGAAVMAIPLPQGAAGEAVAALEALEVNPATARRAIAKALKKLGDDSRVEDLVREGLRFRHAV